MREVRLDEVLARSTGGLPVPVACWLLARAAHAIATRPRLLTPDAVRIRDDGGVRVLEPEEPIPPFAYRAPEVVRGEEPTARSAVFGLGVLLVESLTGRAPFARGSDMETRIAVTEEVVPPLLGRVAQASPGLDAVVQKALAKAPADRYASTVELGEALDAFLEDELHEVGPEDVRFVIAPEQPAPHPAPPAREARPVKAPVEEKKEARPPRSARPADGLRTPVSAPPERVVPRRAPEPEPLPPAVSIPPLDRPPAPEPRAARAPEPAAPAVADLEIASLAPAAPTPARASALEADPVLDVLSDRGPRRRPLDVPLELDEGALAASRPDLPKTDAAAEPSHEADDFGTGWIKKVGLVLLALLALAILYQFVVRPLLS